MKWREIEEFAINMLVIMCLMVCGWAVVVIGLSMMGVI